MRTATTATETARDSARPARDGDAPPPRPLGHRAGRARAAALAEARRGAGCARGDPLPELRAQRAHPGHGLRDALQLLRRLAARLPDLPPLRHQRPLGMPDQRPGAGADRRQGRREQLPRVHRAADPGRDRASGRRPPAAPAGRATTPNRSSRTCSSAEDLSRPPAVRPAAAAPPRRASGARYPLDVRVSLRRRAVPLAGVADRRHPGKDRARASPGVRASSALDGAGPGAPRRLRARAPRPCAGTGAAARFRGYRRHARASVRGRERGGELPLPALAGGALPRAAGGAAGQPGLVRAQVPQGMAGRPGARASSSPPPAATPRPRAWTPCSPAPRVLSGPGGCGAPAASPPRPRAAGLRNARLRADPHAAAGDPAGRSPGRPGGGRSCTRTRTSCSRACRASARSAWRRRPGGLTTRGHGLGHPSRGPAHRVGTRRRRSHLPAGGLVAGARPGITRSRWTGTRRRCCRCSTPALAAGAGSTRGSCGRRSAPTRSTPPGP